MSLSTILKGVGMSFTLPWKNQNESRHDLSQSRTSVFTNIIFEGESFREAGMLP